MKNLQLFIERLRVLESYIQTNLLFSMMLNQKSVISRAIKRCSYLNYVHMHMQYKGPKSALTLVTTSVTIKLLIRYFKPIMQFRQLRTITSISTSIISLSLFFSMKCRND